jgi:hypothetical protein
VAACKQRIQVQPTTPASVKVNLEHICEKAATGNASASATAEVLQELLAALSH